MFTLSSFAMPTHARRTLQTLSALFIGTLAFAGCSASNSAPQANPSQSPQVSTQADTSLRVNGAWVKAMDLTNEHAMTAAFMELTNPTEHDLTITGAHCECATMVEIHETVMDESGSTVMQEMPSGLTIKAGETRILEPGKEHIMLMGLTADIIAGDQLAITLTLAQGDDVVVNASVRDFNGAKEEYSHQETQESDHAEHHDEAANTDHSGTEDQHDAHSSH